MEIETVKWTWAENVKNKQIYRDDELIRTKTKEDALKAIDFLMIKYPGSTYTITVLRDGEYLTYSRHSMPCLGGLVKYRDSHGDRYKMNPYFPRDIRVAFPEGEIVYIACHRPGLKAVLDTPYGKFAFSAESPWQPAFVTPESVIFKDNYFVLTNMDGDPTVLYSLMRLGGLAYGGIATTAHPKAAILAFKTTEADPRRLCGQKPVRTSGGKWSDGFGYTRPYNESVYKTQLPTKVADLHTLPTTGYPPTFIFTNDYFVTEMKTVFDTDVSQLKVNLNVTPELEAILLKAWDHFKEEAKKLGDE